MTTNREKLNNMSNEELAEFLFTEMLIKSCCRYCIHNDLDCFSGNSICQKGILQWLEQESEE
mgnify:CR=1 FL=1